MSTSFINTAAMIFNILTAIALAIIFYKATANPRHGICGFAGGILGGNPFSIFFLAALTMPLGVALIGGAAIVGIYMLIPTLGLILMMLCDSFIYYRIFRAFSLSVLASILLCFFAPVRAIGLMYCAFSSRTFCG